MPTRLAQVPPRNRDGGGQQSHVDSIRGETASGQAYDRRGRRLDDPEPNGSRRPGAFVLCADGRVWSLGAVTASPPEAAPGSTGAPGRRGRRRRRRSGRLSPGESAGRHIFGVAGRGSLSEERRCDSPSARAAEARRRATRAIAGAAAGHAHTGVGQGAIGEAERARERFRRPHSRSDDRPPTVKGAAPREACGATVPAGQGPRCEAASPRPREAPGKEPSRPGTGDGSSVAVRSAAEGSGIRLRRARYPQRNWSPR
jgi:hypothetical protein